MQTWQRNLYALCAAEFVALAGVSVVFPFLPYYVQELGVTGLEQVEFWSGALLTAVGVGMAIFSPIWGSLADRYGRKLMVERALFGGALVLAAAAFVQNVQQLLVLQFLLGCLAGTVPAAATLVASSVPRERAGYALGLFQMAVFGGMSAGPLVGGVMADLFGYRPAFLAVGGLSFLAGITVLVLVHEESRPARPGPEVRPDRFWQGVKMVFRTRELLAVLGIELMLRLAARMMWPVLPLFVQSLVSSPARVVSLVGFIFGLSAAGNAAGAVLLGRASDRFGYRTILLACASVMALVYIPQFFVVTPLQLLILQAAGGVAMGGSLATIGALLANLSPDGRQGIVFGLDASAVSVANSLAPLTGVGVAMGLGLRAPFLFAAGVYALVAVMILCGVPANQSKQPS
jgi:DHA1 family multidrug resistance protein-like MFS transporter